MELNADSAVPDTVPSGQAVNAPPRVLFALPGLHAVNRGAEVAFESLAARLAADHGFEVTLMGSGGPRRDAPYRFVHVPRVDRAHFRRWPRIPGLRTETAYEEACFAAMMLCKYTPSNFDVTVTCGYPFMNWLLRSRRAGQRPRHVFVTQNGDWPCHRKNSEYRYFGCDLLVCTNPEYYANHRAAFPRCVLIPNGVDPSRFHPSASASVSPHGSSDRPVILMVSALIPSKRVLEGVRAVAQVPDVALLVAGDGPLRVDVERLGHELMPGRFARQSFTREEMPGVFRRAAVLLHMSMDEPFGIVYVEALATGLPIVAHDWPATRWTLEDNAQLVDSTDELAVAAALKAALADQTQDQVRRRVGLAKQRFDWRAIGAQYAEAIKNLLRDG